MGRMTLVHMWEEPRKMPERWEAPTSCWSFLQALSQAWHTAEMEVIARQERESFSLPATSQSAPGPPLVGSGARERCGPGSHTDGRI